MPRDRLAELQKKRDQKNTTVQSEDEDSEQVRLYLGAEGDTLYQLQAEVEAIRKDVDLVELNVKLLKQKHNDIIFQGVCNEQSKSELGEISDNITKTARVVRRKLKAIGNQVEKDEKQGTGGEESRIRKIQHMTLLHKYTDVMKEYLETQEAYKEKCTQLMIRQIKIVNPSYNDDDIEKMMEEENPAIFTGDLLAEQSRARQNLDEAKALNFQIKKVEQSIIEIHELFQDLATLVSEQGESINRIEDQVKTTVINVDKSIKQLGEARKKKTQRRKTCIIIIVVLLIVLAVIIGVIIGVNR